jgi:aryl carrier-like protein
MENKELLLEIIEHVRIVAKAETEILATTSILIDLDLDSLEMLELVEVIARNYQVDLLSAPHTIEDIRTPLTIAEAIQRFHTENK